MSKKVLLEEKATRRMMELAKLDNYSEKFLSESMGYEEEEEELEEAGEHLSPPADSRRPETGHQEEMEEKEMEVDVDAGEGEEADEKEEMLKKVVQAVADALGVEIEVEGGEGEEMGGHDMGDLDLDVGGEEAGEEDEEDELDETSHMEEESEKEEEEEELDEVKHKKGGKAHEEESEEEEEEEAEEEELDETRLSEDDLVENVLKRVTARLIAEAKKSKEKVKEKKDVKKKMEAKKKAKKKEVVEEELKGTNLATKGKNKDKTYPGHADMEMTGGKKGAKEVGKVSAGKGGHEWSPAKKKADHTVSHKK
jgi:hypothetical protein